MKSVKLPFGTKSIVHTVFVCLILITANCINANAQGIAQSGYRLGSGDTISIRVFQEADLSLTATIDSSGVVDYPLVGEVKLNGLTLAEAEAELDKKLRGDYLINPRITISIDKYRPFFISGAVKSPGSYEYVPGMTAMQAVVIAGGFTERASKRKVYVTRENDPAATSNKVNLNEKINAGDTVTVKETFF